MKIVNTLSILILTLAFGFSAALAQEQQMQPPPAASVEVSDTQLEQFAEAQVSIIEIQQDFSGRLQGVDDPDRAHALQVEANEEMTEAVAEAGLDVESFNAIAMAIQNSPELQQRLTAMLQDTQ